MSAHSDFVITVATANGSGSQSANNVLVRALFRSGLPVGGKNLFPSNIQGLPTWFTIRANPEGFTGRKRLADVAVLMNPQTADGDLKLVRERGWVFLNNDIKLVEEPPHLKVVRVPFRQIVDSVTNSVKLKKLLVNMVYVGVLAELLGLSEEILSGVLDHQFKGKESVIESNRQALQAGRTYAKENLKDLEFPYRVTVGEAPKNKILIDGNSASALGLVFGGCTFVAWYPITPSSSLVEEFMSIADKHRRDNDGSRNYAVVQAEDELASAAMVLGAGFAGARAMTATSGPGLSLMSEAAGLAYYAEVPAVIWDVQRVGPSTGLPTRTMQGDVLKAYYLSHGDTKHIVLFPATPAECFEFGQTAFDLAEQLQTLVLVLSDLDLGMNLHISEKFAYPETKFQRGKVLTKEDLEKLSNFHRYEDRDGDGITYRTLPGTEHPKAAYLARGTGHDEAGRYSEDPEVFKRNLERLKRKFETAKTLVPRPQVDLEPGASIGLIYFGSSLEAVTEARVRLKAEGVATSALRLKALPFTAELEEFLRQHDRVYVVEQNRDGQMLSILRAEYPEFATKARSVLHFDGLPLDAETVIEQILTHERAN